METAGEAQTIVISGCGRAIVDPWDRFDGFKGVDLGGVARALIEEQLPLPEGCEVVHAGARCGRPTRCRATVGGERVACCDAHYHRAREGATGDGFTRPIGAFLLPERCEVVHRGARCDRSAATRATVGGVVYACCTTHYSRAQSGKTGDGFAKPIGSQPLPTGCEVLHDGVACDRPFASRATVDGVVYACCNAHCKRANRGLTGDAFTNPTSVCLPLPERCEVSHSGARCDRPTRKRATVEGVVYACCVGHESRAQSGKTGDGFTKPIGPLHLPLPEWCEVVHNGVRCVRPTLKRATVEGVVYACCAGHSGRAQGGKTGAGFTKPIRT